MRKLEDAPAPEKLTSLERVGRWFWRRVSESVEMLWERLSSILMLEKKLQRKLLPRRKILINTSYSVEQVVSMLSEITTTQTDFLFLGYPAGKIYMGNVSPAGFDISRIDLGLFGRKKPTVPMWGTFIKTANGSQIEINMQMYLSGFFVCLVLFAFYFLAFLLNVYTGLTTGHFWNNDPFFPLEIAGLFFLFFYLPFVWKSLEEQRFLANLFRV